MSSRVSSKKEAAMELFCVICQDGGITNLESAVSRLKKRNKFLVQSIGAKNFVSNFPHIFKSQDGVKVEAVMPLKFCLDASEKSGCLNGESCVRLHLCPYFIRGKCTYEHKCRCSHDIKDRHTMAMLVALGLENIDDSTWFQLLKKVLADTQMERGASTHDVPDICKYYNNQGGCREGEKCAFLHVCQHFVDGTCKFGAKCKRDHDLLKDKHNRDVFEKFSLGSANCNQLIFILRGRERKRTTSTGSDSSLPAAMPRSSSSSSINSGNCVPVFPTHHAAAIGNQYQFPQRIPPQGQAAVSPRWNNTNAGPVSPRHHTTANGNQFQQTSQPASAPLKQSTDICGFFLRGKCNYGQNCMNQHRELPYQWQLQIYGSGWKDLSQDWNIMLERRYSEPSTNKVLFYDQGQPFKTDFDKMIAVAEAGHAGPPLQLRRLSTESSADAPPGHIFSTRWLWYWQDEIGQWQSYDSPDDGYEPSTTCSKSLEKDFLQDKDSHPFSAGHHSYTLYYKKMLQKNDKFQTERAIRRRPEFVDKERMKEVEQRRKEVLKASKAQASSASEVSAFPPYWNEMSENDEFKKFPLPATSQEYKDIEKKFQETLDPKKKIKKIERIQNTDLWMAFTHKRGRMTKKANDTPPKEEPQLFHGTTTDVVDAICQQGFDWRLCGKHGTLYGKGSYFASAASYSHCYAKQTSGSHYYVFVARVLVGSYVEGDKSYTRPPPKDPSKPHGDLYDSCVNDTVNPSLFVVFDNSQSYPEYLITYK